jgi:hypothetical protein
MPVAKKTSISVAIVHFLTKKIHPRGAIHVALGSDQEATIGKLVSQTTEFKLPAQSRNILI